VAWQLTAHGKLFHSGLPHKSINPIELAMVRCARTAACLRCREQAVPFLLSFPLQHPGSKQQAAAFIHRHSQRTLQCTTGRCGGHAAALLPRIRTPPRGRQVGGALGLQWGGLCCACCAVHALLFWACGAVWHGGLLLQPIQPHSRSQADAHEHREHSPLHTRTPPKSTLSSPPPPPPPPPPRYGFATSSTLKPTQWSVPAGSINQIPGQAVVCGDIRVTPFYDVYEVRW